MTKPKRVIKGGVKYTVANIKLLEEAKRKLKRNTSVRNSRNKTIKAKYIPRKVVLKTIKTKKKIPIDITFNRTRKFIKEILERYEELFESNNSNREYIMSNYSFFISILVASLKELVEKYSTILDEELIEKASNSDESPDSLIEFLDEFVDEMKNILHTVEEKEYNTSEEEIYYEFMGDVHSEVKHIIANYKDELERKRANNTIVIKKVNDMNDDILITFSKLGI
jgi:hypothetical protein